MVELRELSRKFDALTAVDKLTLSVAEGEIFGLVGPDGAGKTTTLRMLCSLLEPTGGSATVAGFDVVREARAVKDAIGYMAQRFGMYVDLSVDENLEFYADLFGVSKAERDELLPSLLRMTRMEPFRTRQAGKLSGGMKQKLALMCTLIHRPKVLFLDEPTNGVDPVSRRDFWAILYQLVKEGMTVFVTTAYLDEAERCNRVALIDGGRLIECDTPQALKSNLGLRCYEVSGPRLREARAMLEKMPAVKSVAPAGSVLHLFTESPAEPIELALRRAGFDGAAVREIAPSLEDVFIALVRRTEAA